MRCQAFVTLALLPVVTLPAGAAEFIPGWDVDGAWSSNVFRTESDPHSDFSVLTGPNVRLRQPTGDLTYDLNFRLRYQDYVDLNGVSDFEYFATAKGAWSVTNNTKLELSEGFVSTSNLGFFDAGAAIDPIGIVTPGRERVTSNALLGAVTHRLGPLWQLRMEATNNLYDYQNPEQSDSTSTRGSLHLIRTITRRLEVGGGTQVTRQEFDSPGGQTSGTSIYQGFGLLNYRFSRTLSLSAQAGPAYALPDAVDTQSDVAVAQYIPSPIQSCPTNAAGTPVILRTGNGIEGCSQPIVIQAPNGLFLVLPADSTAEVPLLGSDLSAGGSLNYFGRLALTKEWRQWEMSLIYNRSASSSSGFGQSTVLDVLSGEVIWTPSRLWNVSLTAAYSTQSALSQSVSVSSVETALQEETRTVRVGQINPDGSPVNGPDGMQVMGTTVAAVPVPFEVTQSVETSDNKATVTTLRIDLHGVRRITRNLSVNASASYWNQENNKTNQDTGSSQRDVYRIGFGFTWTFDPIPL